MRFHLCARCRTSAWPTTGTAALWTMTFCDGKKKWNWKRPRSNYKWLPDVCIIKLFIQKTFYDSFVWPVILFSVAPHPLCPVCIYSNEIKLYRPGDGYDSLSFSFSLLFVTNETMNVLPPEQRTRYQFGMVIDHFHCRRAYSVKKKIHLHSQYILHANSE